jgi:hypothetical protein
MATPDDFDFDVHPEYDACQRVQAVECWESYFFSRYCADDWEESQKRVAGAFSQAPHLLREHRATTIRVVDGSPAVFHQNFAAPAWQSDYSEPAILN